MVHIDLGTAVTAGFRNQFELGHTPSMAFATMAVRRHLRGDADSQLARCTIENF